MNMEFIRKLPIPKELKKEYPLSPELKRIKLERDNILKNILSNKDNRFILIIGPCSADNPLSVIDYIKRLATIQEKVKDKIFIVPRLYTNKPRTMGIGYKGMLHQPVPSDAPDVLKGIISIRQLYIDVLSQTGFSCADELLYPENHRYISDLLSYATIGARSCENQQHRLTASGLDIPVGIKNPTNGYLSVMINSIVAAQSGHRFIYRNWEVESKGNPYTHAILRGYENKRGMLIPNYHYEDLELLHKLYTKANAKNPSVIIDTNHANSGKCYIEQIRISKEVINSKKYSKRIDKMVKGLMIESYIEDGCQDIIGGVYGKSITDPCLGWEKTERLILDIADLL